MKISIIIPTGSGQRSISFWGSIITASVGVVLWSLANTQSQYLSHHPNVRSALGASGFCMTLLYGLSSILEFVRAQIEGEEQSE